MVTVFDYFVHFDYFSLFVGTHPRNPRNRVSYPYITVISSIQTRNPVSKPPQITPKNPETGFLLGISQLSLAAKKETRFLNLRRPPPKMPETGFIM
jgi:hypothetical protein